MRREVPFPCAIHGNPADVTAQNLAWLALFDLMREYSEWRQVSVKGKDKTVAVLNIPTLKILCDEMELDFGEAFRTLTLINRIFNEA